MSKRAPPKKQFVVDVDAECEMPQEPPPIPRHLESIHRLVLAMRTSDVVGERSSAERIASFKARFDPVTAEALNQLVSYYDTLLDFYDDPYDFSNANAERVEGYAQVIRDVLADRKQKAQDEKRKHAPPDPETQHKRPRNDGPAIPMPPPKVPPPKPAAPKFAPTKPVPPPATPKETPSSTTQSNPPLPKFTSPIINLSNNIPSSKPTNSNNKPQQQTPTSPPQSNYTIPKKTSSAEAPRCEKCTLLMGAMNGQNQLIMHMQDEIMKLKIEMMKTKKKIDKATNTIEFDDKFKAICIMFK
jgi:hypothetical protein